MMDYVVILVNCILQETSLMAVLLNVMTQRIHKCSPQHWLYKGQGIVTMLCEFISSHNNM